MGMYTQVRGWVLLNNKTWNMEEERKLFEDTIKKAEGLSPRIDQCVFSTIYNMGFNGEAYIFIGGAIKNYDNDWEIYIRFLKENFDINEMHLEKRYEEDDDWTIIEWTSTGNEAKE